VVRALPTTLVTLDERRLLTGVYVVRLSLGIALAAAATFVRTTEPARGSHIPLVLAVVGIPLAFTLVSMLYARRRPIGRAFLYAQVLHDMLLVTLAVILTGGVQSEFALFYLLLIAAAGLLLGLGGGAVTAVITAGVYLTISYWQLAPSLARRSAAYNGLESRYEIRHADFRHATAIRDDERFDLVLGSPPYFPVGTGLEGDHPQKVACRFELRGDIGDYARVAAAHLAPGGVFACVFPEEQRARVEAAAAAASLAIVRRRPVVFREGEPPLVTLFAMTRISDLPDRVRGRTWVEPPLVIRTADGRVHPEYAAVKLAIGFPP